MTLAQSLLLSELVTKFDEMASQAPSCSNSLEMRVSDRKLTEVVGACRNWSSHEKESSNHRGAVLKKKPRPLTGHVSVKEVACLDVGTTSKAGTQRSQPATSGIQRGQV